jgi:hypothetical protein
MKHVASLGMGGIAQIQGDGMGSSRSALRVRSDEKEQSRGGINTVNNFPNETSVGAP